MLLSAALAATITLAALAAGLTASARLSASLLPERDTKPGRGAALMPTLPTAPRAQKGALARWERRVDDARQRAMDNICERGEPSAGLLASQLAAQLGEPVEVAEAVLARMADELDHRLRVQRDGQLVYDFSREAIQRARTADEANAGERVAWTMLAATANIGAAWPMLSVGAISLSGIWALTSGDQSGQVIAFFCLAASAMVLIATMVLGLLTSAMLEPGSNAPRIDDSHDPEEAPIWRRKNMFINTLVDFTTVDAHEALFLPPSPYQDVDEMSDREAKIEAALLIGKERSSNKTAQRGPHGGVTFGGYGSETSSDEGGALVAGALGAMVIATALMGVVWVRGLWRASRQSPALYDVSPTLWVRRAARASKLDMFVPTNELVGRLWYAVRGFAARARPQDQDLAARILCLARARGARISALEIALSEGLDIEEATRIGAKLSGNLDGGVHVSDHGDVLFTFPARSLERATALHDPDAWAEFIDLSDDKLKRRRSQSHVSLPVNLPGLTYGHLRAASLLVSGSALMSVMLAVGVAIGSGSALFGLLLGLPLAIATSGAMALTRAAHEAARVSAEDGVRRDLRRAAAWMIRGALERGAASVDPHETIARLEELFTRAWKGITRAAIEAEIEAMCADLGLEITGSTSSAARTARRSWGLGELRERLDALGETDTSADIFSGSTRTTHDDDVVFDTATEVVRVGVTSGA